MANVTDGAARNNDPQRKVGGAVETGGLTCHVGDWKEGGADKERNEVVKRD